MRLRSLIVSAALVTWVLVGCGSSDEDVSSSGSSSTTSTASTPGAGTDPGGLSEEYRSESVTEGGIDRPLVAGTSIIMTFSDGTVGAQLGCNSMSGEYRFDGDLLVVEMLSTTEMGCDPERHAQDTWFAELLSSRPQATIDGSTLTLTEGSTVVVLRDADVVDPDRSLSGTRWSVTGWIDGDAASSASEGVDQWIEFDLVGGTVSGFDGCAAVTGSVRGDETKLVVTELGGDEPACPQIRSDVERFHRTLEGTLTASIEHASLTLLAENGSGVTLVAND